jgi:Ca-activated chloride channel family protein
MLSGNIIHTAGVECKRKQMQKRLLVILFLACFTAAKGQYYFRGDVKDASNQPLPYAQIHIRSTNNFYYSGSAGSFGIPSSVLKDSAVISLNGYETQTVYLRGNEFNHIILKVSPLTTTLQKKKRLSVTLNKRDVKVADWPTGGETYTALVENEFNETAIYPETGFALSVDKASYSNIRRFINMNSMVPPDAVRIEEMLNYFPLPYTEPEPGKTFGYQSILTDCPWNTNHKLLLLRVQSRRMLYDSAPPANIVLVVDVSGSMEMPNRLPLLQTAFRLMVKNLRPVDTLSIITYGGSIRVVLPPTGGSEQQKMLGVIDSLQAGGETPGGSALKTAYNYIQPRVLKGGNNRIILATDGDFNVGEITEDALIQLVAQKQQSGVYLTCLGVGVGNYKDSKLEALAKKGNGNFAYIDNVMEAEKVLVTECMQTFFVSAGDAFMNLRFDAALVKQYRLIGFDNRKEVLADSTVTIEGGEIGSGHTFTAVFEIEPAVNITSLNAPVAAADFVYTVYGQKEKTQEHIPFYSSYYPLTAAAVDDRFAVALTWLGLLLKQSAYLPSKQWDGLVNMLTGFTNEQHYLRNEFIQLVLKAKQIYQPEKKKKKGRRRNRE